MYTIILIAQYFVATVAVSTFLVGSEGISVACTKWLDPPAGLTSERVPKHDSSFVIKGT